MPARLITPIATVALAAGLILSLQSQHKTEAADRHRHRDLQHYAVGACQRDNVLRSRMNRNVHAIQVLRSVVHQNVSIAAETDPSARLRWASQARKLEGVEAKHMPLVDCSELVKKGLPQR